MIVKILSSAGSFSGVEYNENKVDIGTARQLAAENFGLLELDGGSAMGCAVHEYQHYFKNWSATEKGGITNPQFHAVISCEGRENTAEELKVIAEQYLEKMGYKQNPYLIYFHSDTANNHVHMVTSRVGDNGLKINDSFERRRSQAAIKEILGIDAGPDIKDQLKKAMTYNFSSEAQFKMILERKGVKIREKDRQYQLIKDGRVMVEVPKYLVTDKINAYQEPTERISQLKALFVKYKPALEPDKFAEFMKVKFGVEIMFHQAKGKDTPYGYSILDHSKGQIFKGSQIMPLASLLALAPIATMIDAGTELITALAENETLRYRDFKIQLAKLGFVLNSTGHVKIAGEEKVSFIISKDRIKQTLYNDRLYEANKFTVTSQAESQIVGRIMGLRKDNYPVPGVDPRAADRETERLIISDKLNSLLSTGKDLGDIAKENNYTFAKNHNEVYLVDKTAHALYAMASLTNRKLDYSSVDILDTNRLTSPEIRQQMEFNSGTFAEVASLVLSVLQENSEENQQEVKRKRKRNH